MLLLYIIEQMIYLKFLRNYYHYVRTIDLILYIIMLEVMKLAGMDFVILDMEHDQLTFTEVMSMIRTCDACGLAAMVRVPSLNETMIRKVLDMGASAVKVPDIHTAEEARKAVAYAK